VQEQDGPPAGVAAWGFGDLDPAPVDRQRQAAAGETVAWVSSEGTSAHMTA
jgi:hypothetical protein